MRALVIGMGISGKSAARFLKEHGYEVVGFDDRTAPEMPADMNFELAVVSPGVPPTHRLVGAAKEAGVEVIGEAELACRYLTNRAVGITGTNGKTTTTLLVTHVLKCAGKKARALGNVGTPLTEGVAHLEPDEIAVIELSSYQLETLQSRVLDAAVILNITPDHLDRHGSLEAYAKAKLRIADCLKQGAPLFAPEGLAAQFDLSGVETFHPLRYSKTVSPDVENGLAAYALCQALGVGLEVFDEAWDTFKKPSHRLEPVREIDGITFINDSKGTNVAATQRAVEGLPGPIVLIAGGRGKGQRYDAWAGAFRDKVSHCCLIGEAAEQIASALDGHCALLRCQTFEEAVEKAREKAKPGTIVLLSPGCASFDMFENYAARGDRFKELINKLKGEQA